MPELSAQEWETLVREEAVQLREEGKDPTAVAALEEKARASAPGRWLWEEGGGLPYRAGWEYEEPSDLAGIVAARPGPVPGLSLDCECLPDRMQGAWLGRCAGCMLGKPVEGHTRENLRRLLEAGGEYPLGDYFGPLAEVPEGLNYPAADSAMLRGNIRRSERDDDTDYPVLNLGVWQGKGAGFSTEDVGAAWLLYLPYHQVYTAERVAYRNLVCGWGPPETAVLYNPYREWIGAQIRADLWGYVAAGQPLLAAQYAWRDAALSHVKNGIYGEMYFAALIAAALAARSLEEALAAALATVPARSRFAEMVADCAAWCASDGDWEKTRDRVEEKYGAYHPVHTINNAAVVLLGLLYGGEDFGRVVGLAVQGGWDTDCNGATAGSVWGALHGAKAIPEQWSAPLNDTVISAVFGREMNSISGLARETLQAAILP